MTEALGSALSGLAAGGVAACLKHFPGHGDTKIDSHLALPVCSFDRASLDAKAVAPFRAHLSAPSIMSAHVVYPALDGSSPGTFSKTVITELLREQLGYDGVCVTDALEMKGAAEGRGPSEVGRLALEAGCDLLMYAFHDEAVRRARLELAKMLVDGVIGRENFDAARPRLAAFDSRFPEPGAEDLARPLSDLTPQGWESRVEGWIERGLIVRGTISAAGAWFVEEPEFPRGATMASLLAAAGVSLTSDAAAAAGRIVAIASRVPLAPDVLERLRAAAREKPMVLLGLQNDAFLDDVPEAALRIWASDCTEPTRRVAARRVAELTRSASV